MNDLSYNIIKYVTIWIRDLDQIENNNNNNNKLNVVEMNFWRRFGWRSGLENIRNIEIRITTVVKKKTKVTEKRQ